jgi:hypothetical protein
VSRSGTTWASQAELVPQAPAEDGNGLAELASLACVDVVDMKGHYRNATVAIDPDPDLYRRVFERLPGAWIEDPAVTDHTWMRQRRHGRSATVASRPERESTDRAAHHSPGTRRAVLVW